MPVREDQPFIARGDRVTIRQGASLAGIWQVAAARYATEDPQDDSIELVLTRGASLYVKTLYDPHVMEWKSETPPHMLARDLRVGRPLGAIRRVKGSGP